LADAPSTPLEALPDGIVPAEIVARTENRWLAVMAAMLWDVMNGIATALTDQETVDVASYFASRAVGLLPVGGEGTPRAGHSLRQTDPAIRLIFAGDPERGIPPCSACHGPGGHKLGAPAQFSVVSAGCSSPNDSCATCDELALEQHLVRKPLARE
jgi:cytochrome c553